MATETDAQCPQLRKRDFYFVKYAGGVDDALWQHREAVACLLGDEEATTRPLSWDLPRSPRLPSIFDFGDPVFPPLASSSLGSVEIEQPAAVDLPTDSPEDNDDAPFSAENEAVRTGTDPETLALVREVHSDAQGLRRPRRAVVDLSGMVTPSPSPPKTASPPANKKRKRDASCEDEHDSSTPLGDHPQQTPASKRQKRIQTDNGANIGMPLPAAVQREVNYISAMKTIDKTGYPSRNQLRKAKETAGEISRKTGYLMTVRRGGSLRKWFGDESIFDVRMWRWLVGEHEEAMENVDGDKD